MSAKKSKIPLEVRRREKRMKKKKSVPFPRNVDGMAFRLGKFIDTG